MSDRHFWVCVRDERADAAEIKDVLWRTLPRVTVGDVSVVDTDEIRRAVWEYLVSPCCWKCNRDVMQRLTELGFSRPDDLVEED